MTARRHDTLVRVTERIRERSRTSRAAYLKRIEQAIESGPVRGVSRARTWRTASPPAPRSTRPPCTRRTAANIAMISAYNDVLSAHLDTDRYPAASDGPLTRRGEWPSSRAACRPCATASPRASPAWSCRCSAATSSPCPRRSRCRTTCSTRALCLGVCDKIVPGLLIGALAFGHLPVVFVPGGPMPSGLPNNEKARVRQLYAEGKVGREELLEAEARSYHAPGTCTFYGTANSNQMLMEIMGLHLPGASFVNPDTPLRDALTARPPRRALGDHGARRRVHARSASWSTSAPSSTRMVGLLATGGSTNHTIHLVAMAQRGGDRDRLGRLRRAGGGRAAPRAHLSERRRRRERLPRGGRHGVPDRRAPGRRSAARRRARP